MKLNPGDIIDQKYQIVRVLGAGGMGAVYEATNLRVGRRVAIKVMHDAADEGAVARFEREARAAQIGSPYIVQVTDLGYLEDKAPYMVMEYLAGESLGARIDRQGSLRPSELLPIAKQVLEALGAAHRAGIVHRDLKPDNVFLTRPEGESREIVKLVDFGISKIVGNSLAGNTPSLTQTGVAVGTPHYMSPEQVQGAKGLDGRSDLYSLGVMLYRCLSGTLPFNADEIAPLLVAILLEVPKPLRELVPDMDRELAAIVSRAMARRADDRYQTAAEFLEDLAIWETAHAGSLDVAMVPTGMTSVTRTSHLGTAASWAQSAVETQQVRKKTMRTGILVVALSCAGIVALLVAGKLVMASRNAAAETEPSASVSEPLMTAPAAMAQVVPVLPTPAAMPPAPVPSAPASQAAPAPVVPAARPSQGNTPARAKDPAPVPAATPATPAPAAKTTRPPPDQSGRHILNNL